MCALDGTDNLGNLCKRGGAEYARMRVRLKADLTPEAIMFIKLGAETPKMLSKVERIK